jgi:hypothetical protein
MNCSFGYEARAAAEVGKVLQFSRTLGNPCTQVLFITRVHYLERNMIRASRHDAARASKSM